MFQNKAWVEGLKNEMVLTLGYFVARVMAMFKKDLCKLKIQIFGLGPIIMWLI